MKTSKSPALLASQVLVSVGTLSSVSAVGSTETHRAKAVGSPLMIGFAAFDAGLVEIDLERSRAEAPYFTVASGEDQGHPIAPAEIEARWGTRLREAVGIRELARERLAGHVLTDIGAPLPHDFETGGLRRRMGLTFGEIRQSRFADMFGLFDDDPRLGPSLQSELFLFGGLGALAALPVPLSRLVDPHRFRVAAGAAFPSLRAIDSMSVGMQPLHDRAADRPLDKLAYRLSSSLSTHGPALICSLLSPAYNLGKVKRNPAMLADLRDQSGLSRVPQAPLVSSAACASALVNLCDIAPTLIGSFPGSHSPKLVIWTAADAALEPDGRLLEGFGVQALMSRQKLELLNAGRGAEQRRHVSECLCPFDVDAQGTVVGHAGSGVLLTTLDFALRNFLDVTSILVGFGQSGETGGKGHFAGVGFGGENALILALEMALAHGYGVEDFRHLVAHATGTRTNSRTDLLAIAQARAALRSMRGLPGPLPAMTIGAPKAIGDGHTMGETGLRAVGEALQYVLGERSVGVPTLRNLDPELNSLAEEFRLSDAAVLGDADGGALVSTQGFGGYNGALALRSANPDALRRYVTEPGVLEAYLERWPELRKDRVEREARSRRTRGFVRLLAEEHCWPARA